MKNAPKDESESLDEHDRHDELEDGTKLLGGLYTITRFLNAGGFGITYLATDSLERTVVIKECFPAALCRRVGTVVKVRSRSQEDALKTVIKCFAQEARSLSKLDHPNIVKVHLVFDDNETAYMAIDYVNGPDLLDLIDQKSPLLTPSSITSMLRRMLDAIGYIHSQGLLHRDISPDNILVDEAGKPILIDFGAAREQASRKTRVLTAVSVVKDGYSPQEFYLQGSQQSNASDLYALGASFYHVITGEAPPPSQERLFAVAEGKDDPYQPLAGQHEGYSEDFLRSIDKAMEVVPKNRVQSAAEWLALMDGTADAANVVHIGRQPEDRRREETKSAADDEESAAAAAVVSPPPEKSNKTALMAGAGLAALVAGAAGIYIATSGGSADESAPQIVAGTTVTEAAESTPSQIAAQPDTPAASADTEVAATPEASEPPAIVEAPEVTTEPTTVETAEVEPTTSEDPAPIVQRDTIEEAQTTEPEIEDASPSTEVAAAEIETPDVPVTTPDAIEPSIVEPAEAPTDAIALAVDTALADTPQAPESSLRPVTRPTDLAETGAAAIPDDLPVTVPDLVTPETLAATRTANGDTLTELQPGTSDVVASVSSGNLTVLQEGQGIPLGANLVANTDQANITASVSEPRETVAVTSEMIVEQSSEPTGFLIIGDNAASSEADSVDAGDIARTIDLLNSGVSAVPAPQPAPEPEEPVVAAIEQPESEPVTSFIQIAPPATEVEPEEPAAPTEPEGNAFEIITFGGDAEANASPTAPAADLALNWPFVTAAAQTEYGRFPQIIGINDNPIVQIENDWLRTGLTIMSINGQLVETSENFQDAFEASAERIGNDRLSASVLVIEPGADSFAERILTLPLE
ncbi:protein kinase domain-containing protein [Aestuariibius insulae]|uniref:serine/threonine-protein kinase n=1 Tax=Aestuariibius insulae TaxID=2058287 RepID=UPI00345EDCE4